MNRAPTPPHLVLLHGFALHAGIWDSWRESAALPFESRALDLPGHGTRPWDARIRDLAALASSVAGEIPPGAILVGWSLGGTVALELARQRQLKLRGIVLVASTPRFVTEAGWQAGIAPAVLDEFAEGLSRDCERTIRAFLALQVQGAEDAAATLRTLRAAVRGRPPDPRALEAGLEILRRADLRDTLGEIHVPSLVIAGQHDRVTPPEAGLFLAARLREARFRRISGAGHAPFLSHPAPLANELSAFLQRLEPAHHRLAPACV